MPRRRPSGLVGLREAEFRVAHPGEHRRHGGGSSRFERAVRTWTDVLMSHEVQTQEVTPWQALLQGVTRAWERVVWVDTQLVKLMREAGDDQDTPAVRRWLQESRRERILSAKVASAAIQAGVSERLTAEVELNSAILLRVMTRTLDELGLDEEQRLVAITAIQRELLAIEGPEDLRSASVPQSGERPAQHAVEGTSLVSNTRNEGDDQPLPDQPAESDLEPGTRRTEQPREHLPPLATAIDPQGAEPEVWPASRPEDSGWQRRTDGR